MNFFCLVKCAHGHQTRRESLLMKTESRFSRHIGLRGGDITGLAFTCSSFHNVYFWHLDHTRRSSSQSPTFVRYLSYRADFGHFSRSERWADSEGPAHPERMGQSACSIIIVVLTLFTLVCGVVLIIGLRVPPLYHCVL